MMINDKGYHENDFNSCNNQILDQYIQGTHKLDKENQQNSYRFNPLRFFGIGETMQSFLIAKLLDPNGEHGQKSLFLKEFLREIGVENQEDQGQKWIVTAEKGRIDILIKGSNPPSVVIIENKSHNASDQPNQLYRYWYNHMYLPFEHKPWHYALETENKFRLIYLARNKKKHFSNTNTLMRPEGLRLSNDIFGNPLPNELDDSHVKVLTFNKEIVLWLTKCIQSLDEKNHRLREYLKQYIELCQSY